jgi:transcriptional regulator with XRE-family HTH domain
MDGELDVTEQTFGARLKHLREQAGLTQLQLADKAGMNQYSVAKLEQDQYSPTWPTVQALAKALGLNCLAFEGTVEATAETKQPRRPGRPRKAPPAAEPAPEPPAGEKTQRRRKKRGQG